ncbi:MAG: P-loop NTPase [Clostridiales bacterium]|jgi:flagellar biosynthesis protein FlhG|nr:P-loop NTPase [Clostridiales bacterium]
MMEQAQALHDLMKKRKDAGVQVITVTSAKGGVGKSSIALNMAIALGARGRNVLLVDLDLGLSSIDLMLGVKTRHNLLDVAEGRLAVQDIIETSEYGVQFISGGSGMRELINMQPQQTRRMISCLLNLRDVADTIIFDTGSGISEHIIRLVCASHVTWLVTTPEPTAMMDAYALIKQARGENITPVIQLILNKAESEKEAKAVMAGFAEIAEKYTGVRVLKLGHVLRDMNMVRAVKAQQPILAGHPKSPAAMNINDLADRFLFSRAKYKTGLTMFLERFVGKTYNG